MVDATQSGSNEWILMKEKHLTWGSFPSGGGDLCDCFLRGVSSVSTLTVRGEALVLGQCLQDSLCFSFSGIGAVFWPS